MTQYERALFKKGLENLTERQLLQTIVGWLKSIYIILAIIMGIIVSIFFGNIFGGG